MRYSGLPLATSSSRANNTPCQTLLCPKRRPPRPQQPIFSVFHRGGLHFEHHTTTNRDLTTTKRGNFATRGSDTSATRHQLGPHAANPRADQIGNQRRAYSPRLVPNCGIRGQRRGLADLQSDADHPPIHQAPPVWRATRELRDKRDLAVGLGGGARGRRGLDGMRTAMKNPTCVESAGGSEGLAGLRDRRLRAAGSRVAISRAAGPDGTRNTRGATSNIGNRAGRRPPARTATQPKQSGLATPGKPAHTAPQRHEAATGFPATASSRSISATQQSGTTSDQAVMSTWSSTAARPASRRATGTRKGEQDT